MKPYLAALLLGLAVVTPAAACDTRCIDQQLSDDSYYPGASPLPPTVQEMVIMRDHGGLSLAGLYNDPFWALAHERSAYGYGYGHRHPRVIMSRY